MSVSYQPLTPAQIDRLKQNGCYAEDWKKVSVVPDFNPHRFRRVDFAGDVCIGSQTDTVHMPDGSVRSAGIVNARLRNVTVGDQCYIANVGDELANLKIGDKVVILDVGRIACDGESTFGNAQQISVLNEAGGRELKITELTNAQIAYLTVMYRHQPELVKALDKIADDYAESQRSTHAAVGDGAVITHVVEMINVKVGNGAQINGAQLLREGSVVSDSKNPVRIGHGVVAEQFIIQRNATVVDGAIINSSLIGEGCKIGKQFFAENSAIFSNSEGLLSEVCSIFAGPYSVTHHRSTLLIAGMFSFFNAGSGTNQSNHMYKLGPVHQGVLERGCKTGSSSYLLWPVRVGAFSAIIGRHYANFDTADLPFSYINVHEGRSAILPGVNFFTTGTFRDGRKWPKRDRRPDDPLDLISFDVLSPYTMQKVIRGQKLLADLYEQTDRDQSFVLYQGIAIKRLVLKTSKRYYQLIMDKYFGDTVIKTMKRLEVQNKQELFNKTETMDDEWLDLVGLICRSSRVKSFVSNIIEGKLDMNTLHTKLHSLLNNYVDDEWNWCRNAYQKSTSHNMADMGDDDWLKFWDSWKNASIKAINMVAQDAKKEFEGHARISFGIDGEAQADFLQVRGEMDENPFLIELNEDIKLVEKQYDEMKKIFCQHT